MRLVSDMWKKRRTFACDKLTGIPLKIKHTQSSQDFVYSGNGDLIDLRIRTFIMYDNADAFVWIEAMYIISDFSLMGMHMYSENLNLAVTFAVSQITELHISEEFPCNAATERQHVLADKISWVCTGWCEFVNHWLTCLFTYLCHIRGGGIKFQMMNVSVRFSKSK